MRKIAFGWICKLFEHSFKLLKTTNGVKESRCRICGIYLMDWSECKGWRITDHGLEPLAGVV